jgi:Cu(I)/Ag(I) efflux system membrane fusion protein
MKKIVYACLFLAAIAGSFAVGSWSSRREPAAVAPPGITPAALTFDTEAADEAGPVVPGAVRISPAWQQIIGVRVGVVEQKPVVHTLRLLGRVAPEETRVYRINAAVDGWIQKANPNTVGSLVKKGETLASYYSTQLLDAQQAYLYAVGGVVDRMQAVDRIQAGRRQEPDQPAQTSLSQFNVQRQIDALRGMGMSEAQIDEVGRTRTLTQDVRITAPAKGFITTRNVSDGQRFLKGTELYQIADLSRIWVLTDVFENEARYFKPGLKATLRHPYQEQTLQATVSEVLPAFDPVTRTLKVRLEAENPGFSLRPDMFVDVELTVTMPPSITVPAEAILFSGVRKTVFVDLGNGGFEPRKVETGRRLGERVEIVSGLSPGERIVLSGNFLLDSESRLQAAAQGIFGAMSIDPACGAEVDELKAGAAGNTSVHLGRTYFFSSKECQEQFDKEPSRYISKAPGTL